MAKKTILVSDISGEEINDKDSAKVTITYSDARRGQIVLDVNASRAGGETPATIQTERTKLTTFAK
jgi:hypothetical protein